MPPLCTDPSVHELHAGPMDDLSRIATRSWPAAAWRDVHVVVAVSGGVDSLALAAGLIAAKRTAGGAGRLWLGHVNHQLRDAESDRQEQWVAALAGRLQTPLAVERRPVSQRARRDGDGVEAAARAERYAALAEMAEARGARYVAVGHTRDDQVETVLMRLQRGAGLRGLGGMQRCRPLSPSVSLVRPLLAATRQELLAALEAAGLEWFHDSSNDDPLYARNRVRHELLPALRSVAGPDLDAAILELADDAREACSLVESQAQVVLAECRCSQDAVRTREEAARPSPCAAGAAEPRIPRLTRHDDRERRLIRLDRERLAAESPWMRAEVLRAAWREVALPEQAMTRRHWQQLAQLAESKSGATLNLPGNLRAIVAGDVLAINAQGR
ncbi:MAG: tRNA lysidine(34) synthetase TilS [Pirellulales bacterium]|nr:tRNA lysidine(34) synthetase TilS [Pirellulales bacterium]